MHTSHKTAPQAREEMELKLLNDPVVNQKVVEMQKTDKHTSCNSYTYIVVVNERIGHIMYVHTLTLFPTLPMCLYTLVCYYDRADLESDE